MPERLARAGPQKEAQSVVDRLEDSERRRAPVAQLEAGVCAPDLARDGRAAAVLHRPATLPGVDEIEGFGVCHPPTVEADRERRSTRG